MKGQKITVVEYVRDARGREVRVDELEPERYETFRRWLGVTWLNGICRGRAEFSYPEATGTSANSAETTAGPRGTCRRAMLRGTSQAFGRLEGQRNDTNEEEEHGRDS